MSRDLMKPFMNVLIWIVLGVVIAGALFAVISSRQAQPVSNNTNGTVTTNITQPEQPPPQLIPTNTTQQHTVNVTLIQAPNCAKCNTIDNMLLQQTLVQIANSSSQAGSVSTVDLNSSVAAELISKYNITLLPCLLVSDSSGFSSQDVSTWQSQIGSIEKDGYLVQRKLYPPFFNVSSNSVVGLVTGIAIQADNCDSCTNASLFMNSLEQTSTIEMVFTNKTVLDENSTEAQTLIAKYNITELPTLFLSLDATAYPIYQQLNTLGDVEGGWFILRAVHPPYVDLTENHTIRGLVQSIQIVNNSCSSCFNVNDLSDYFVNNAGIELVNKTVYDINSTEAQTLVKKYNITTIPTVMYSPELSVYPHFDSIWTSINNTIASDGWHIFRDYNLIGPQGTYENLTIQNASNSTT